MFEVFAEKFGNGLTTTLPRASGYRTRLARTPCGSVENESRYAACSEFGDEEKRKRFKVGLRIGKAGRRGR